MVRHVAVGFLHHAPSGRVLLHLRSPDRPPSAGLWAFFGGGAEPEDRDDPRATWCRELREELGAILDPARCVSLRHGTYPDGSRWHEFHAPWPSPDTAFVLTEGQRYAWFTLEEALALPDLAPYARDSLRHFRAQRRTTSQRGDGDRA